MFRWIWPKKIENLGGSLVFPGICGGGQDVDHADVAMARAAEGKALIGLYAFRTCPPAASGLTDRRCWHREKFYSSNYLSNVLAIFRKVFREYIR